MGQAHCLKLEGGMMTDFTGLGAVSDLANSVINKIWPDKTEAEKQQLAAAVMVIQGQLDINKVEAASPSLFVSGWRPARCSFDGYAYAD